MKKRIIKKLAQRYANFIYKRASKASTKTDFDVWFNLGMGLDRWCVARDIWLD
jgi:hypothetical protein